MGIYKPTKSGQYTLGTLGERPCATWLEDGKRRRFRLAAERVSQADADALLHQFARQRSALQDAGSTLTVAKVYAAYCQDRRLDGKSTANAETYWKNLAPMFGALAPSDIDKGLCHRYRDQRVAQGRKLGTVWTEFVMLRTLVNWARKQSMIEIAPHITIPPKPAPRDTWLTPEQLQELIEAADQPHIRLYIIVAISTAGRMGAILDLTWDRVDFAAGLVQLHNPNRPTTHKGRATVPMTNTLRAALLEAHAGRLTDHVIEWHGSKVADIKTGLAAAARRAGVKCSSHTLRHTAARRMAEAGVPMEEIASYMGHSTPQVTYSTYARFSPSYLRGAAAALELPAIRRKA